MYRVGLTGGIASGKSTVAARFAARGMPVIDADEVAREIVAPGTDAIAEIIAAFGADVLAPDGTLRRAALAGIVFADQQARATLERITHPRIQARMEERIAGFAEHQGPVVAVVPLLVEVGRQDAYDAVVVVAAPPETQHRRLVEDRGMDPDEAWQRIRAQAPLADRLAVADHVISNDAGMAELLARADAVAQRLEAAA